MVLIEHLLKIKIFETNQNRTHMVEAAVVFEAAKDIYGVWSMMTAAKGAVKSAYGADGAAKESKLRTWLLTGSKMVWVSKNKKDCFQPYIFKDDGYVTTPFPVGDYKWRVISNTCFEITGWTTTWTYDMKPMKGPDGKTHHVPVVIASPMGGSHNGVVMTDVF